MECYAYHANLKAVDLGTGIYAPKTSGLPLDFEWERIVDEDGNQIQDTSHVGARPFIKEELQKIQRVGTYMTCHAEMPGAFWNTVKEKWGTAATNETHRDVLKRMLR